MALAGMHISCHYLGTRSIGGLPTPEWFGKPIWSETMASPGTTTAVAPAASTETGPPMMFLAASADSYVALGPNPNATTGPRMFVRAGTYIGTLCDPGDKLAWVAA